MTTYTWPLVLRPLMHGESLATEAAAWAMDQVMSGAATSAQLAAFVVALRTKGETADEMEGLARGMLAHARRIEVPAPAVDVVGTGGDLAHTVNISTMAAIVVAGAGVTVVKHGNRAASSACGTADVLEELGLPLTLTPEQVEATAREAGIAFCFAQVFHPAMRHAAAVRSELGVPTSFNFLGPLTNPAQPAAQAIGCADRRMAAVMAEVFARRGVSALVFRGDDGLDELTTTTTSQVWEVREGAVEHSELDPGALGLPRAEPAALRGGDRAFNAGVVRALVAGEPGPVRDAVVLNAAAALVAHDSAAGALGSATLTERVAAATARARDAIDTGSAAAALERWIDVSRRHATPA